MSIVQWIFVLIYTIPAGFGLLFAMLAGIMAMGYSQDDSRNTGKDHILEGFKVWLNVSLAAITWPVFVPFQIYKDHRS